MQIIRTLYLFGYIVLLGCNVESQSNFSVTQYQWSFPDVKNNWDPKQLINGLDTLLYYQQIGAYEQLTKHRRYEELLFKVTDTNSYDYFYLTGTPITGRFKLYFLVYERVKKLSLSFYNLRSKGKFTYGHEITLLHNFLLGLQKIQLDLSEVFLTEQKTITKIQREGLEKMIYGAKIIVSGNFLILEKEFGMYDHKDICSQAQSFYNYYNFLRSRLDSTSRNEFDQKLKQVFTNHSNECIRNILKK